MRTLLFVALEIVKFVALLPFRVVAFAAGFVLGIVSLMVKLLSNMGAVVIGLFNLLMLLGLVGVIISKEYSLLIHGGIIIGVEAAVLLTVGLASGLLDGLKDVLWSFAFGRFFALSVR